VPFISPFFQGRDRSRNRPHGELSCLAILGMSVAALSCWFDPIAVRAQEGPSSVRATEPRALPRQLAFAHGLFRERKFDLAAEEYRRFLEQDGVGPDADDARFGLAAARLYQGKYKEARAAFEEFLAKAPRHPRARTARYRLGELSYMLGDLAEARKAL